MYIFHRGMFVNHGYIRKVDEAREGTGYEGEELKIFVKDQQVILRYERQAAGNTSVKRVKRHVKLSVRLKNVNLRRERPNN